MIIKKQTNELYTIEFINKPEITNLKVEELTFIYKELNYNVDELEFALTELVKNDHTMAYMGDIKGSFLYTEGLDN